MSATSSTSLSNIQVETTRARETPRPALSFGRVLQEGARVLLAGAEMATSVVGGPLLSAAVSRVRAGADVSLGGASLASGSSGSSGTTTATGTGTGTATATATGTSTSSTDALRALQQERMGEELQLLALQNEVQRHDRQVSLVSNLMKARHDTAKQAIGNIRS